MVIRDENAWLSLLMHLEPTPAVRAAGDPRARVHAVRPGAFPCAVTIRHAADGVHVETGVVPV